MADPGAQLVMFIRIDRNNACADLLNPLKVFSADGFVYFLSFQRSYEPSCALKQIGICELDAGLLFSSHRMSAKKTRCHVLPEDIRCVPEDLCFCAADIGEQHFG